MSPEYESPDENTFENFIANKRLTGVEKLDQIIGEHRQGQWFDSEGYEDLGLTLMLSAESTAFALENRTHRIRIANVLWPIKKSPCPKQKKR